MRRPLAGALLGILVGVAIAVLLQQHGIWPLDKLAVFLLPAITGLLGMLSTRVGRIGDTWSANTVIALVLTLGMAVWGLIGVTEIGATGGGGTRRDRAGRRRSQQARGGPSRGETRGLTL